MGDAVGDGVETRQVVLWDAEYGLTLNKVVLEGACCEFKAPGLLGRGRASLRHWGGCSVEGDKPHVSRTRHSLRSFISSKLLTP